MGDALPDSLPLFPLPDVVLFPEMPLPLHIFEPRYRQMVADARGGEGMIGMVLLKPGWEATYYGRPAVFPIGCAGRIEQYEALPDGRYNIVLRGTTRFTIVDEPPGPTPYRRGRITARDEQGDEATLQAVRNELIDAIEKSAEHVVLLHDHLPPALFVNALCQSLDLQPVERQSLLDCDDRAIRCRRLIDLLELKTLERRSGSSTLH